MAIINQASKELQVKVVYYGPAVCGKTTNLVQVHDHVQTAQGNKGKLVSLATSSDRTLFFDFLPIEAMAIKGFKTKFQLYTCLLYTSDAADERSSVDLGGRRIIKKK